MVGITDKDVRHLAKISALNLTDSEIESLRQNIEEDIDCADKLKEVDVSGVEPTCQIVELTNVWRDDQVDISPIDRDKLLMLAPDQADGQVKAPRVL